MTVECTAVYREVPEGSIAVVKELPGANRQGATLDEARESQREAVTLVLETNRALALEALAGTTVIRETFRISAWAGGVKRVDLIRHLEARGFRLLREGGSHSVDFHPESVGSRRSRDIEKSTTSWPATVVATLRSPSRDA